MWCPRPRPPPAPSRAPHAGHVPRRDGRYNFIVLTLDGLGFWLGMSYFSPTTILPLFVSYLTPSNVLVGAVPAVVFLLLGGAQLARARALALQPSRKRFIIHRTLWGASPPAGHRGHGRSGGLPSRGDLGSCSSPGSASSASAGPQHPGLLRPGGRRHQPSSAGRFLGTSQFLGGAVGAPG